MKTIKGVSILGVEINFYCIVQTNLYDLGAVTLYCEDRNFILDIVSTEIYNENNHTLLVCELAVDEDTFPEGEDFHVNGDVPLNYNLKAVDFQDPKFRGTVYIGCEYEVVPESQTLFIKHINNEDNCGMTQAVELELD